MKKRLIILGLDGFNKNLLNKNKDVMPNLWNLSRKFGLHDLKSTFVPTTGPAWTSFQTGVNLDKHKRLGFVKYDKFKKTTLANSKDIKQKTIYFHLYKKGNKVFLMNLPFTYPAKIKGDIVTSWLTPGKNIKNFLNPPELIKRYKNVKSLKIIPPHVEKRLTFLKETENILDTKISFIKEILKKKRYDFYFFLISETDWIQHKSFLDLITKERKNTKEYKQARRILQKVDNLVKIIMSLDKEYNFLIMSDHGFGAYKKRLNINDWLEKEGYLSTKRKKGQKWGILAEMIRKNKFLFKTSLDIYRFLNRKIGIKVDYDRQINFRKTKAFCPSSNQLVIRVSNTKIRMEIMKKLAALEVKTKEVDWYPGLLIWSNQYFISSEFCGTPLMNDLKEWHSKTGVLTGNIKLQNGSIVDIYPTICELMKVNSKKDLDGNSLLL